MAVDDGGESAEPDGLYAFLVGVPPPPLCPAVTPALEPSSHGNLVVHDGEP